MEVREKGLVYEQADGIERPTSTKEGQPLYPLQPLNEFPLQEWSLYIIYREDFWHHQLLRGTVFLREEDFLQKFRLFIAQHVAIKQVQKSRTNNKVSTKDSRLAASSSNPAKAGHQCAFESCKQVFKRQEQARACEDKHRGVLRYMCKGVCGVTDCPHGYRYASSLARHANAKAKCDSCGESFTRQNLARHKTMYCQQQI
ncbi:hypothetical protein CPB86DRAFT_504835 [Serendipita vermifera]|nr:hypothetical protein CPB86DRAFT_504835 [Serendipita vermifera]